jgi:hypothetical protein
MDLSILMKFTNSANKSHSYTKRIEFCGIKDFRYTKDFISFIEYGRLSETNIKTENVIDFTINHNDDLFD